MQQFGSPGRKLATCRTLQTNEFGVAPIPLVPPGNYDISVTAAGFKNVIRRGVAVAVGSVADVPITLEAGSPNESVTVTAEAPVVEDKSATLGDRL